MFTKTFSTNLFATGIQTFKFYKKKNIIILKNPLVTLYNGIRVD